MIKIGITGGIGSGKSVVAQLLSVYGIPVYIADDESKKLTNTSPLIREQLTHLFGPDIYNANGLNKTMLAKAIFGNKDLLQQVNHIIHPEVNRHFLAWCEQKNTYQCCAIESAILFESGFNKIVDVSLLVYAPFEIRIQRALQRDHSSEEALRKRIESQISDEEKRSWVDYTITNDGKQALIPQVEKFLDQLYR